MSIRVLCLGLGRPDFNAKSRLRRCSASDVGDTSESMRREQADRPWAAMLRERWLRYTETSTDASPRAGARHPETGADPGDEHRPQTGEHHRATPAQDRTLAGVVAAPLGAPERRTAVGLVVPCRVRWGEVDQHRGSVREDHEE